MASKPYIKYYVVDAFTESALRGNPAAVCILEEDREEKWYQSVAREFNLSATCYVVKITDSNPKNGDDETKVPKFRLRWFAPSAELNICGHGTIGATHALFQSGIVKSKKIEFHIKSGKILHAERIENMEKNDEHYSIRLEFPLIQVVECDKLEREAASTFTNSNEQPINVAKMSYEEELIVEYSSGTVVADLHPSIDAIRKWRGRGVVVTGAAPQGSGFDFYSRFFCPNLGMVEDPVCGSIHCGLAPYWSQKLGTKDLKAYMASPRGGELDLHVDEEKQQVFLQGKATLVMEGSLFL